MIEPNALFAQYQDLQRYVSWTPEDATRVRNALPLVQESFPALIDDFYREIDAHPAAKAVITGGEEQVERLKGTLLAWVEQLFSGVHDAQYVTRRWKVGWRHVEIGLSQIYTNMALSRLRDGLIQTLVANWKDEQYERALTIRSLNKLLDLDLAIIEDAYQAEFCKRQQQTERLAAIGQMSGGVAHELRNPLNVIKTSVYYLLNARTPSPEKINEHLKRIERQVDAADEVTTALSDFAKLSLPVIEPFLLEPCLQEVLDICVLPGDIIVSVDIPEDFPNILADRRQMMVVFGNLIRNARDAMPKGGQLKLTASHNGKVAEVAVTDTGEGISEEHLDRILEPLYSTKTKGIGLGLAITRAILEKHHAQIVVQSELGSGTTFTVKLPIDVNE